MAVASAKRRNNPPFGFGNERNCKMEFLKTPRTFAIELAGLNDNSAGKAMEAFLFHLKAKASNQGMHPGVGAAWAAEVIMEIAKLREEGLLSR